MGSFQGHTLSPPRQKSLGGIRQSAEITHVLQPLFAVERLVANKAGWQAPSRPSSRRSRRRRGPKASLDGACHPAILGSPRATAGCTCGCIRRTDAYGRLLEARSEPRLFRGRMAVPWHHTRSRRDGIDANTRKPSSYGISFAFEASWSACRLTFGAPTHPHFPEDPTFYQAIAWQNRRHSRESRPLTLAPTRNVLCALLSQRFSFSDFVFFVSRPPPL